MTSDAIEAIAYRVDLCGEVLMADLLNQFNFVVAVVEDKQFAIANIRANIR